MSRIHEALKRAEQERATSLSSEAVLPGLIPGAAREAQLTALRALDRSRATLQDIPDSSASGVEEAPAPITLEALLARCPKPTWRPDPKMLLFGNGHHPSPGTEEFRTLRSRLYQIRDRQSLRTVLITSALPSEGKTFTSANLAAAIARQHERRVLLIDADMRRPGLHVLLGAPATPGLTDYLKGQADEFSIVQRGLIENLFFLPSGEAIPNPTELLANGRMKFLIERLAPLFDWVLMDSPPAMGISDAAALSSLCDGVLLVVQAGRTPFDIAQKAREEFRDNRLLGAVLNRVGPRESYQSYYSGYYAKRKQKK